MYTQVEIKNLSGVLLFRVKRTTLEGWGSIYKRIFDIVVASLAIIILSPIYILTIIAIKLDSPGPILYKNKRVGVAKKMFNVYKFRSMYQDMCTDETNTASIELEQKLLAEKNTKSGPLYKIKDDPRVTRLGKFIRRTSIDELPQFFNVLQGTMSLVGPRPHQPREVDKYKQHHKKVLTIKPGITGMAQINGRSDLSFEEEVLYDTFYIENWSIWLDIIILLKTPWAVIAPRKAD
jgi:exopolysaccharide biosynthesis polyprenyl glycosylphosphotransferase